MTKCEFGEKEYENRLNVQLGNHNSWTPDPFFENLVGFDIATLCNNYDFWILWQKKRKNRQGIYLDWKIWEAIKEQWAGRDFPPFKFNLFVQCKVPQYINRKNGSEYQNWNQPYFRYDLTDHQQDALVKLEKEVSSDGLVVYACPSFYQNMDLYSFWVNKLIKNSNFVQPRKLKGHTRYTFIQGGKNGKACSEVENIEGVNILSEIEKLLIQEGDSENNILFINKTAQKIRNTIEKLESIERKKYWIT